MNSEVRDHLFINYAVEDSELANWLTLKLTSLGYRVWCDKFELLGGESYPKDIPKAIKTRTFRMLSLLSKYSISKDSPLKERTIANNVGRELKIGDFIIPLNLDGLKPVDLDLHTTDKTWVPFDNSWAEGLAQLIKKLEKIECPKPIKEQGKTFVIEKFIKTQTENKPETIYANLLKIKKIPKKIKKFQFHRPFNITELNEISRKWAAWKVNFNTFFSFHGPPADLNCLRTNQFSLEEEVSWEKNETADGIKTENIIKNLIVRNIKVKLLRKGLAYNAESDKIYFRKGTVKNDKISFVGYAGKTYVTTTGMRKKGYNTYNYYLAPAFLVKTFENEQYLQVMVKLHFTDKDENKISKRSAFSSRKHIGRGLWNKEWLLRTMAITSFLADGKDKILIGQNEEELEIESNLLKLKSPVKVLENKETEKSDEQAEQELLETEEYGAE